MSDDECGKQQPACCLGPWLRLSDSSSPQPAQRHRSGDRSALWRVTGWRRALSHRARINFVEVIGASPVVEARRREVIRSFASILVTFAGELMRQGTIPTRDARTGALALIGGVQEVLRDWVTGDERHRWTQSSTTSPSSRRRDPPDRTLRRQRAMINVRGLVGARGMPRSSVANPRLGLAPRPAPARRALSTTVRSDVLAVLVDSVPYA